MGELHLEIIFNRLRREFRLSPTRGSVQVAYRERARAPANATHVIDRAVSGKSQYSKMAVSLEPLGEAGAQPVVDVDIRGSWKIHMSTDASCVVGASGDGAPTTDVTKIEEIRTAIREGVRSGCQRGAAFGFPLVDVHVSVVGKAKWR